MPRPDFVADLTTREAEQSGDPVEILLTAGLHRCPASTHDTIIMCGCAPGECAGTDELHAFITAARQEALEQAADPVSAPKPTMPHGGGR